MKKLLLQFAFIMASGIWSLAQSQEPQSVLAQSDTDLVKVYVREDPANYKKANQDSGLILEFAVQLSASSRPVTDKSSLRSWEELGPVYIHTENGLYKVRIGPFDNQDQAKEVLLRAKERGKKDAFIVIQKGLENYVPEGIAIKPLPETGQGAKESILPAASLPPAIEAGSVEYKVRLASYLKPGGFNTKDIDKYGPLESYRKGEWTIMLIGGFKTEADALRVKDKVIAKGYKDASVVVERDGILELND